MPLPPIYSSLSSSPLSSPSRVIGQFDDLAKSPLPSSPLQLWELKMSLQGGRGGERAPKGLIGPRRERSGKGRRMLTPSTCSSFDSFRFWTGVNCCSDYAKGSSNFVRGFFGAGETKVSASRIPSFFFSPPTLSRGQNYEPCCLPPCSLHVSFSLTTKELLQNKGKTRTSLSQRWSAKKA